MGESRPVRDLQRRRLAAGIRRRSGPGTSGGTTSCRASNRTTATAPSRRGRTTPRCTSSPRTSTTCTNVPAANGSTTCTAACSNSVATVANASTSGQLPDMPEPVETVDAAAVCVRRPDQAQRGVVRRAAARATRGSSRSTPSATPTSSIVVGTSSIVYPAAGLPELALANGIPVIEVNPERTPLSDAATVTVRETAAGALPTLLQRLPSLLG